MAAELSVIIPTYRRGQILLDSIEHLLGLTGLQPEIIVVDQTEEHPPQTRQGLEKHDQAGSIRWIHQTCPGITPSMNVGAKEARGNILLFLDDDIIPHEQLIAAHLKAHLANKGELVAGRVLQPWHEDSNSAHPFTRTTGACSEEFMGGNFSIRRDLLFKLGGLDENFKGAAYNYEREFADRLLDAGYRIWYEPEAQIRHLHHTSGGTRSGGDHLTSWKPHHPVGAYYYLFVSPRVRGRYRSVVKRLSRSVMTRHHLRKPWYIPVTLTSEILGLSWALVLRLKGQKLPFRNMEVADQAA